MGASLGLMEQINSCKFCESPPATCIWGEPSRLDIYCNNYQCHPGASITSEPEESFADTINRWNQLYGREEE